MFTIRVVEAIPATITLTRAGRTINAGDTVYGTGMRNGEVYGSGFGVRAPISITLSSSPTAAVNLRLSLSSTQSINVFVRGITSSSAVATVFNLATGSSSQLSALLEIDNSTNTHLVVDFCVMTSNACLNDRDTNLSVAQQLSLEIAYKYTETASTQTITVTPIDPDFLALRTQNERQEFTITRNDPNVSAVTLANISSDTSGLPALKATIESAVSSALFTSTPSAVYADGNVLVSFGTAVNIGSYSTIATLVSGARTRTFMFTIRVVEAIPATITLTRAGRTINAGETVYGTGVRNGKVYGSGFGVRAPISITLSSSPTAAVNLRLSLSSTQSINVLVRGITSSSAVATVFKLATGSSSQLSASLEIDNSTNTHLVVDFCVMTSNACLNDRDTKLSVAQQLSLEIAYRYTETASTQTITVTPIDPDFLALRTQNERQEFTITRNDPNVSAVTLANISSDTSGLPALKATIESAVSSALFTSTPSAVYADGNVLVSFGTAVNIGSYSTTATLVSGARTRTFMFTIRVVEGIPTITLTRAGRTINAGDTVYGTGVRNGEVYGSGFGVRAPISITLSSSPTAAVNLRLSLSSTQSINVLVRGITSSSAVATVFKLATGSSSQLSASLEIDNSTNTHLVVDFCVMTSNACLNDRDTKLSVAQQLSLEIAYRYTETASTQTITVTPIDPDFLALRTQNERQEFTITRNDPNVSAVTLANISSDTSGLPALKATIESAVSSALFTSTPSAVYADGNVLVSFGTAVNIGSYSTTATLVSGARTRTFMFTIRVVEGIPTITLTRAGRTINAGETVYGTGVRNGEVYGSGFGVRAPISITLSSSPTAAVNLRLSLSSTQSINVLVRGITSSSAVATVFKLATGSSSQLSASLEIDNSTNTHLVVDFCVMTSNACLNDRDTKLSVAQQLSLEIAYRYTETASTQTITVTPIDPDFLALRTQNERQEFTITRNDPNVSAVTLANISSDTSGLPALKATIESAVSSALFTSTPSAVYADGNVLVSFGTAVNIGSYSTTATLVSGARTRTFMFTIRVVEGIPTITLTRAGRTINAGETVYGTGVRNGEVYGSGFGVRAPISITLSSSPTAAVNLRLSLSSTQSINVLVRGITSSSAVATVFKLATGSSSQLSASLEIDNSTNTHLVVDFCVMTSNACLNDRDTKLSVAQQLSLEIAYRYTETASTQTITVTPIDPDFLALRTQNERQEFTITRNDPNVSAVTLANISSDTSGLPALKATIESAVSSALFTSTPSAVYADGNVLVSFGTAVNIGSYSTTATLVSGARTRTFMFTIRVVEGIPTITLTRAGRTITAGETVYGTGVRNGEVYGSGFGVRAPISITLSSSPTAAVNLRLSLSSTQSINVLVRGITSSSAVATVFKLATGSSSQLSASLEIDNSTNTHLVVDFCVMTSNACLNDRDTKLSVAQQLSLEIAYRYTETASTQTITVTPIDPDFLALRTQNERQEFTITRNDPNVSAVTLANISSDTSGLPALKATIESAVSSALFTSTPSAVYADGNVLVSFGTAVNIGSYSTTATLVSGARTRTFMFTIRVVEGIPTITLTRAGRTITAGDTVYGTGVRNGEVYGSGFGVRAPISITLSSSPTAAVNLRLSLSSTQSINVLVRGITSSSAVATVFKLATGSSSQLSASLEIDNSTNTHLVVDFCVMTSNACLNDRDTKLSVAQQLSLEIAYRYTETASTQTITVTPIDPDFLALRTQNERQEFTITRNDPNVSAVTLANISSDTSGLPALKATIESAVSSALFTSTPSAVYADGNVLVSFGTAVNIGSYSTTATLVSGARTRTFMFTIRVVEGIPTITLTRAGRTINAGDTVYGTGVRNGEVYGSGFGVRAPISITLSSSPTAAVNLRLSLSSTQSINVLVRGITSSSAVATVFKLATGSSSQLSASLEIDNSTNTHLVVDFCVMTSNACLNDRDTKLSVAQQLSLEIAYRYTETASTQTITVTPIDPDFLALRTQNERQEFTITRNDPNVSAVTLANISSDTSGLPALKATIESAVSSALFTSTPSAVYADGNVLVSFGTAVNIGSYSTTATLVSGARTRTFMFTIRVVEGIPTITLTRAGRTITAGDTVYGTGVRNGEVYGSGFGVRAPISITLSSSPTAAVNLRLSLSSTQSINVLVRGITSSSAVATVFKLATGSSSQLSALLEIDNSTNTHLVVDFCVMTSNACLNDRDTKLSVAQQLSLEIAYRVH